MTNAMIIMLEQERLVQEGILTYTGQVLKGITPAGEEIEIKEIQPIHTYAHWQALGFQVKKGEKSNFRFGNIQKERKKT